MIICKHCHGHNVIKLRSEQHDDKWYEITECEDCHIQTSTRVERVPPARVIFSYVGDRNDEEHLLCQYQYDGQTYRVRYQTILEMSRILNSLPEPVRKDILYWCDMIHNPD